MPIYLRGEDDFAIQKRLRDQVLDPQWVSFNYFTPSEQPDAVIKP